jgi:hypothetical protein
MLRTNADKLVKISVMGEAASPVVGRSVYNISATGTPLILPGVGGITYNLRVARSQRRVQCAFMRWKRSNRCQR